MAGGWGPIGRGRVGPVASWPERRPAASPAAQQGVAERSATALGCYCSCSYTLLEHSPAGRPASPHAPQPTLALLSTPHRAAGARPDHCLTPPAAAPCTCTLPSKTKSGTAVQPAHLSMLYLPLWALAHSPTRLDTPPNRPRNAAQHLTAAATATARVLLGVGVWQALKQVVDIVDKGAEVAAPRPAQGRLRGGGEKGPGGGEGRGGEGLRTAATRQCMVATSETAGWGKWRSRNRA